MNKVVLPLPAMEAMVKASVLCGAAGALEIGRLFPPPGNAELISTRNVPALPVPAENNDLRIRLTQMPLADSIGKKSCLQARASYS